MGQKKLSKNRDGPEKIVTQTSSSAREGDRERERVT
jgi:hypothetical protein